MLIGSGSVRLVRCIQLTLFEPQIFRFKVSKHQQRNVKTLLLSQPLL